MAGPSVIVIGAGPAGLAAAHELTRGGLTPLVLESAGAVGGIARTEIHAGCRFDIGGHRFYTRNAEVLSLWRRTLGPDLRTVRRLSRIHYGGQFFNYPLRLLNTLHNLGPVESSLMLLSYLKAKLRPARDAETFEQWVTTRFGSRLYQRFFRTYTEKVWGMSCRDIRADWAAQRIGDLSMTKAIRGALVGRRDARTLIGEFLYPTQGAGMMWRRFESAVIDRGGEVRVGHEVVGLHHEDGRVRSAVVRRGDRAVQIPADSFISSMPLTELVARLRPAPPPDVRAAAAELRHRAFILVGLVVDRPQLFPDNWVYVHSPNVRVGRVQNFGNWSPAMVHNAAVSPLGMEYFCDVHDDLWGRSDAELIGLAERELAALGLARGGEIIDAVVVREPKAYPVYDRHYRRNVAVIRDHLRTLDNLQTIGRNGMHRYNNQDHSMLTGILAARNLLGEANDLWHVNTDPTYGESAAELPADGVLA